MAGLLRGVTFRHLFAAQIVSLLGTGVMTVALGLLAYSLAGPRAGQVLGTALAIKMVAYVVMAPVMRAVCARWSATAVLVGADVVRILMALALPWVGEVWQVYLLVFALQSASATFTPTFQAVIPEVVPDRDEYTRAMSASRIAYDLESVVSPLLAAALLTVMHFSALFVVTAVGFLCSAALVVTSGLATAAPGGPRPVDGFWPRATAGVRAMVSQRAFRGLLAANVATAAATAVVIVSSVVYVRSVLGLQNAMVAVALGVFGGGSIVVALLLPWLLRSTTTRRVIVVGAMICGAGLAGTALLLAVRPGFVALATVWFVLGIGTSLINTASPRLLRDHTDDTDRDAVFTAQFSLSHAAFLATYPIAGWAPAVLGVWGTPLLLAVVAVAAGMAAALVWPPHPTTRPATPTMAGEPIVGGPAVGEPVGS